ncbi:hypothetical protein PENTCL1PPCAC_26689 [Pristionchus entomophagus]|uniref:G protein-coupled receptor n=1 Tax=Pristionchus entomophagus TaxID=358040 RepID=A0AAV5UED2_9BILA|nr:hypothetical protein PENTCL1PPCAC_26689 [Pristionchus entomophagus]
MMITLIQSGKEKRGRLGDQRQPLRHHGGRLLALLLLSPGGRQPLRDHGGRRLLLHPQLPLVHGGRQQPLKDLGGKRQTGCGGRPLLNGPDGRPLQNSHGGRLRLLNDRGGKRRRLLYPGGSPPPNHPTDRDSSLVPLLPLVVFRFLVDLLVVSAGCSIHWSMEAPIQILTHLVYRTA